MAESSFTAFRNFISEMEMGDIKFRGNAFTWQNNRVIERYIKDRLDRFFGSVAYLAQNTDAEVKHIFRVASDHHIILLDSTPGGKKTKARFIFDSI